MITYIAITGVLCFVTYAVTAAVWRVRLYDVQERVMNAHRAKAAAYRFGCAVGRRRANNPQQRRRG